MKEALAKAFCEAAGLYQWDATPEPMRQWYRAGIDAVLKAMREPTPAMVKVAEDTPVGHSWGSGGEYVLGADIIWQAMIDEAMK